MTEPENLFEAKAESLSGTMGSHGGLVGFIVPEYQRTYDWKIDNIKRLMEDCLSGFDNCWRSKDASSYTFLGTIILVNEKQSKERSFDGTSLAVVDGQQRLTTLSFLCCILVEALVQHQDDIAPLREPTRKWLREEVVFHMVALSDCVIGQLRERGTNHPFPRIVRRADTRAANPRNAEYRSVVAKFLQDFAKFFDNDASKFEPTRRFGNKESERMFRNYDFIKEQIELALDRVNEESDGFVLDFDRTGRRQFGARGVRRLFEKLDLDASAADKAIADVNNTPAVAPLIRLIAFSSYVTKCVILTRVETEDDSYAFDIFDALNTTGEPLTAIETLRPRIIQLENRDSGFVGSECEQHLNTLSEFLDEVYSDTEERQKATKELLVSFALYLDGHKLGYPLNAQRTYLRNGFDGYRNESRGAEQRRRFVKAIADLSEFRHRYWDLTRIRGLDANHASTESDDIKLCFAFIKAVNTSLALPLLGRYWVRWRDNQIAESEFREATKAIAAFIVLRRAVTGGTANIDSEFRRLMRDSPRTGGDPFCAGRNWSNVLPTSSNLKAELRERYLKKPYDAADKEAWVNQASSVQLANRSRPICRFLLLAASHNARPNAKSPGLLTRDGVIPGEELDYLSFARWDSGLYATVEHVAPDSDSRGAWDATIYSDGTRHSLGNLVLLPHKENTSIGNAKWAKKKLFYRALAARTDSEKQAALLDAQKNGLSFNKKTMDLLAANEQLRMLDSLDAVSDWTRPYIERRSKRLLELAWDQIWPWLDH